MKNPHLMTDERSCLNSIAIFKSRIHLNLIINMNAFEAKKSQAYSIQIPYVNFSPLAQLNSFCIDYPQLINLNLF